MHPAKFILILCAMLISSVLIDRGMQYIALDWGKYRPNKTTECAAFYYDHVYTIKRYLIKEEG